MTNILWIISDDQPPYMLEPMPFTRAHLRDAGINFRQAHCDIPLCGPARVGLLTGMSVNNHGVNVNATWTKYLASPLDLTERTIVKFLKDAGYTTGHFGKYINGHAADVTVPPYWDRWTETIGDGKDEPWINVDGKVVDLQGNASTKAALDCARWVANNAGTPWFAQYCPTTPHRPYTPSAEYEHLYDWDRRDVPSINEDNTGGKPRWMRELKPATGMQSEFEGKKEELRELDQEGIKPLIQMLRETGQLDDTLIIYTSDNGYHHGEHRLVRKDRPYWESAQIPFFVKGPASLVGAGIDSPALVNHLDLFPTTLEVAGVPVPDYVDGRSLVPILRGATEPWRKRILTSGSQASGPESNPGGAAEPSGNWWLLRDAYRQLILRENGHRELYWIDTDPYQLDSKADTADPALVRQMVNYAEAIRDSAGMRRRRLEEE